MTTALLKMKEPSQKVILPVWNIINAQEHQQKINVGLDTEKTKIIWSRCP